MYWLMRWVNTKRREVKALAQTFIWEKENREDLERMKIVVGIIIMSIIRFLSNVDVVPASLVTVLLVDIICDGIIILFICNYVMMIFSIIGTLLLFCLIGF